MAIKTDKKAIEEILTRGVSEVIDKGNLEKLLLSGKQLRIKLGIDPTSPNLHLGRAVVLLKLRQFQDLGHKIVFIVGDFTGVIGDTSDKESERKMLTEDEIRKNMKTYVKQAGKILDLKKAEVNYNSKWLKKLGYAEIGRQANYFSLAEFIARENIRKRLDTGSRVSLRELLYPLMQGYDSVMVEADVELGGTDQRFNLLAGRELQQHYGQKPQDILMTNLILGTDGRKMSSSWGNTINLTDEPNDVFGKVMTIPDDQIITYFEHCTRVPMSAVREYARELTDGSRNPRDVKKILAHEITELLSGKDAACAAETYFSKVIQNKEVPSEMPEVKAAGNTILEILIKAGMANSKSEARRLLEQSGVKVDGTIVADESVVVNNGSVVQKGKRFFVKVI